MLDRTIGDKIKVQSFCFTEAYVEFWARIVNCAFAAILHGYDRKELRSVLLEEQRHANSLIPAVLQTYGITPATLFSRTQPHISEKTNVIAYYIIATILFMQYGKVLELCSVKKRIDYLSFPEKRVQDFLHLILSYKLRTARGRKKLRPGLSLAMTTIRAVE